MFDPEKVERFTYGSFEEEWFVEERVFVNASDYDQLFAGYKEAISQIRTLIDERNGLLRDVIASETLDNRRT